MFDDIIRKRKYDIDVIRKDLSQFISFFHFEIQDGKTEAHIAYGIMEYFKAYDDLDEIEVSFEDDKISISFEKKTLMFPR